MPHLSALQEHPLCQETVTLRFLETISMYDMTQVVEDFTTRPVYYESRVINIKLTNNC